MTEAATSAPTFKPLVPTPAPARLGSRALIRQYRQNVLAAWPAEAYEDDMFLQPMYGRLTVLINSADAIRRVLIDNTGNYTRSRPTRRIIRPLLGDGLFLTEGETWRHQRRILAPAFAPRAVGVFACAAASGLASALPRVEAEAAASRPIDLLAWFQHLTLDVAGRAMFSQPMATLGPAMRRLMLGYGQRYGRMDVFDAFLPLWLPSPQDIGRQLFRRRWFRLIGQLVAERRRLPRSTEPADVFELLLAARDPETGASIGERELRDQIATLIVAGHETTAVALFWAAFLLAEAPAWQERIASEAASLDLSPPAAASALPKLKVTRAVFEEALRLYPPAYVVVRLAKGGDRLGRQRIEPNTVVMIAPWVLQRHRRLWACPDAFDPTRFLAPAPPPDRFAYLPFGAGPRVCIGAPLAMAEATLVLARLAASFRIARADAAPVLPVALVTTQPDRSTLFTLTPR